jgi:hypothetical protein
MQAFWTEGAKWTPTNDCTISTAFGRVQIDFGPITTRPARDSFAARKPTDTLGEFPGTKSSNCLLTRTIDRKRGAPES